MPGNTAHRRHTLRITGGTLGGRIIRAPENNTIRPTADKVRQAIFNILNARGLVKDAVVLDAFCGTGAMGMEALSHGAAHATFFDLSDSALKLCRENVRGLGLEDQTTLRRNDATRPGPRPASHAPATLVFLDPPYHNGLMCLSFSAILGGGWIAPGAVMVLEASADEFKNPDLAHWEKTEILSEKRYGETGIRVVRLLPS